MPTVELSFTALPAHVRTARLVAAAVARRAGVDEGVLDEVRLAVGEACSRAVELHRRHCPDRAVTVVLSDGSGSFGVEVTDCAPPHGPVPEEPADAGSALASAADLDVAAADGALAAGVGLAVIGGLVDDVVVDTGEAGTSVRMRWPAGADRPGSQNGAVSVGSAGRSVEG